MEMGKGLARICHRNGARARAVPKFATNMRRFLLCLLSVCLTVGALRAQTPDLESPNQVSAEVGEMVQFDLSVKNLQQTAVAGTRYEQLRFAVALVGVGNLDPSALDSTTGRFRYTVPCTEAGRTLTLQFKLYNAGVLLATSTTALRIGRSTPPLSASYPELVLLNPDQTTTVEVNVKSVCGSAARLEALPNAQGAVVTVSGSYPSFRVNVNPRNAPRGQELKLLLKLSDGATSQMLELKTLVDNAPRPPYFERDLPRRIELYEDETRPIRIRAYDPNGDAIRYTIKNLSDLKGQAVITDRSEGIVTWTSKADALDRDKDRADYELIVEASDGRESVTETFTVVVVRKVTITQRQQRLRRYSDEYKRLEALRDEAISFYRVVNRRADRRSNAELYRILAKSMFTILAAVSATIQHEQTRVIAVSSASVMVAGVDLVSNRRRKYDPFEDLKSVREIVRNITVALSERKYKYNDAELGDLGRLALKDDILTVTRELATDCDKFAVELKLLKDRYESTVEPFGMRR